MMNTRFQVTNDQGDVFIVFRISSRIPATTMSSSRKETVEGLPTYQLEDGTHLNKIDDHTFKNIRTDEILTIVELQD